MKTNTIIKAIRLTSLFSLCLLLSNMSGTAQNETIQKTFTKELAVPNGTDIRSNGPKCMNFWMNGSVSYYADNESYTITPKGNDDIPALLIYPYNVHSWDEQKIMQEIEISIIPDDNNPKEAKMLMDALALRLSMGADGSVHLNDAMNITKFEFENGFLKRNTNWITLDNGRRYVIKNISIRSSVTLPKDCNFELVSNYIEVNMGDINGDVKLDISNTNLNAGTFGTLDGNFHNSTGNIKGLGSAVLNAKNSELNVTEADRMDIGSSALAQQSEWFCHLDTRKNISNLSKYNIKKIDTLYINDSTNDKITLGSVDVAKVASSVFTDYHIDKLNNGLNIQGKNGDVIIKSIDKDFDYILLDNQVSTIQLDLESLPNYKMELLGKHTDHLPPAEVLLGEDTGSPATKVYLKGDQDKGGSIKIQCESCELRFI